MLPLSPDSYDEAGGVVGILSAALNSPTTGIDLRKLGRQRFGHRTPFAAKRTLGVPPSRILRFECLKPPIPCKTANAAASPATATGWFTAATSKCRLCGAPAFARR